MNRDLLVQLVYAQPAPLNDTLADSFDYEHWTVDRTRGFDFASFNIAIRARGEQDVFLGEGR